MLKYVVTSYMNPPEKIKATYIVNIEFIVLIFSMPTHA